MPATVYPTLDEALFLHDRLIEHFGGEPGIRDMGLLESALARQKSDYYATLSLQTAALMQSLARNPPFVDGNKTMAFALTAVFVSMNGYRIVAKADEIETFLVEEVIESKAELDAIAAWIEQHLVLR